MTIPDTFNFMQLNSETYSFMDRFTDEFRFLRGTGRRGPIQIDEDADIYYGYYFETDESID